MALFLGVIYGYMRGVLEYGDGYYGVGGEVAWVGGYHACGRVVHMHYVIYIETCLGRLGGLDVG